MAAIHECVSRVFATRNATHIAHWNTKSYAEHMALGDFYEGVVDILDNLVETYQGNFGLIGPVVPAQTIASNLTAATAATAPKLDIIKLLSAETDWLDKNREQIAGDVCALENILDELVGLYLKTIYKLKNLS